jgi:hypothetical protein
VKLTISSLQIGHNNFVLAAATADDPPFCKDTTELKSWFTSGNGDVAKGETVPLPRTLPPPSFRPDMAGVYLLRSLRAVPARGVASPSSFSFEVHRCSPEAGGTARRAKRIAKSYRSMLVLIVLVIPVNNASPENISPAFTTFQKSSQRFREGAH